MALTGTYKIYEYVTSETETEEITIDYPTLMTPDDPNYDKRGTTETFTSPVVTKTLSASHPNMYVALSGVTLQKLSVEEDGEGNLMSPVTLNYAIHIYNSREDKLADPTFENSVFSDAGSAPFSPEDFNLNLFDVVYSHLKTLESFDEMVDA
jgi:hypothetical protein